MAPTKSRSNRFRTRRVQWHDHDGQVVILEPSSRPLALNPTAATLWRRLVEGADRSRLVDGLVEEFGIDEFTAARDVDFFLDGLESRGLLHALPRVGARIQSFGAEVGLGEKTSYQHHWVYDLETEAIVCTSSIVNLAFDVTHRRAIAIPDFVRVTLEGRYHPDLR